MVEVDNLGTRFVKMEGLESCRFELETPAARFLQKVLEEGVHFLINLKYGQLTQYNLDRNVGMAILYTFGKSQGESRPLERRFSLREIGEEIFPGERGAITRAAVSLSVKKGFACLYYASPKYLQEQYPDLLNQIEEEHDFMVDRIGVTRAIAGAILTGTTYQYLREKFPTYRLSLGRKILGKYGWHVPYRWFKKS